MDLQIGQLYTLNTPRIPTAHGQVVILKAWDGSRMCGVVLLPPLTKGYQDLNEHEVYSCPIDALKPHKMTYKDLI